MSNEMTTKPTIETVLERINSFENRINGRFEGFENRINERFEGFENRINERFENFENRVNERFARMDERLDQLEKEMNIVASHTHATKAEVVTMRSDFKELRSQIRNVLPDSQPH